jgi:hypothetical protein
LDQDTLPPFPSPLGAARAPAPSHADSGLAFLATLGAAALVGSLLASAVVAQIAFRFAAASPDILSREAAGLLAGRMFEVFVYLEIGATLLIVLGNLRRRSIGRQIATWTIMLALAGHIGIGRAMRAVRAEAGGSIERVAKEDPLRRQFGRLHGYYVIASTVMLAGALAVLASIARSAAAGDVAAGGSGRQSGIRRVGEGG